MTSVLAFRGDLPRDPSARRGSSALHLHRRTGFACCLVGRGDFLRDLVCQALAAAGASRRISLV